MKLRNALLVLSLGIMLAMPTTVSATEYDTTGPNDELSEEEIEALDTIEDEYDVDDYDYSGESDNSVNEGGTEATTPDNPVFESDELSDNGYSESQAQEDEVTEETTEVETPKTGDSVMYYAGGLLASILFGICLMFHKEK